MPRELILVYGIDRYRLLLNVLVTLGPDRHTVLGPKHGERSSRFHRPRRHPIPLRTPEGFTAASTAVPTFNSWSGQHQPDMQGHFQPGVQSADHANSNTADGSARCRPLAEHIVFRDTAKTSSLKVVECEQTNTGSHAAHPGTHGGALHGRYTVLRRRRTAPTRIPGGGN